MSSPGTEDDAADRGMGCLGVNFTSFAEQERKVGVYRRRIQNCDPVGEFVNVEINFQKYPSWQAKAVLEMARVLMAQKKNEQAAERLKDVITRYPTEKAATVAQQYLDELRAK